MNDSKEQLNVEPQASKLQKMISKNSQILALFALACTLVVGIVYELTKDKIKSQEQNKLLSTLHSIIAPQRHNNDIAQHCIRISNPALGATSLHTGYIATMDETFVAIALTTTAPDGYNGNIELMVGINANGSVSGVRVLKHKETPGLGDKIELRKSQWITRFSDKDITDEKDSRWQVAKDGGMFDQFTGATITPRAVVKAVKKTVLFFHHNKQMLLQKENACAQAPTELPALEVENEH